MATVLEELLIQIGVDVDERSMEKISKVSDDAAKALNRVAVAGAAAAAAIVGYTAKMAGAADQSIKFARMTGIAFDSIQELEFAAQREGAAIGELTSNLGGLNAALGQIAIGRGPKEAIRRLGGLGLSLNDVQEGLIDGEDLLLRVGEAIQGMTPQRQQELTAGMGITPGVLKLLQQGRSSIEELRKEARMYGLETERSAKKSEQLKDSLLRQKTALNKALIPLRMAVMEMATNLIPKITKWIENNKALIAQLPRLIGLFTTLFAVSKIIKWGGAIASVTKLVWGLVAAKTALAALQGGAAGVAGVAGVAGTAASGAGVVGVAAAAPVVGILAAMTAATALMYALARSTGAPMRGIGRSKSVISNKLPTTGTDNRSYNFNITEATDPIGVAKEVERVIDRQSRDGNTDLKSVIF